ncbi:MAG: hypothetical protein IKF19_06215 [Bacilli bacterium]|nr:hypothetical protein [Bacilli bacterium]
MYKVKDSGGYYRIWNNDVNSNAYIIMKDSSIGRIINNYISDGMISEDNLTRMCRIGGKSVKKLSSKDLEKVNSGIDKMVSANKKVKKNPKKKCNRKKSLKIRKGFVKAGFYLSTIILLTGGVKHFSGKKSDSTGEKYSTEKSIDDDYEHSSGDYIYSDYNIDDTVEEEKDSTPIDEEKDKETIIRNYEDENDDVMDFYYDDYDVSEESAKNVMQYIDLCKKYCDMYGEDYRLFAATLAQENNGIHNIEYDTPAVSISQMEKLVWLNTKIRAYNKEKKEYVEKWIIAPNVEETIDDDEFNKRPKSGDIISEYGIENVINIETAEGAIEARAMMDAFYREQAYKNGATEKISESDFPAYTKARENKGPIVFKTLAYGDDWEKHLSITNNGDDDYVKKVFSLAKIVSDYCQDYSPYITSVYDNNRGEIIIFAINAISTNKLAKAK